MLSVVNNFAGVEESLNNNDDKEELIAIVNLPVDWWYIKNSYDIFSAKPALEIFQINNQALERNTNKELPRSSYWDIKHGDYRSKAEKSKLIKSKELKTKLEKLGLYFVIVLSAVITGLVSSLIAKI